MVLLPVSVLLLLLYLNLDLVLALELRSIIVESSKLFLRLIGRKLGIGVSLREDSRDWNSATHWVYFALSDELVGS